MHPLTLLQSSSSSSAAARDDVIFYAILFAVLALIGFGLIYVARARLKNAGEPTDSLTPGNVFSLSDLRRLHKQGRLSDEEFESAKNLMLQELAAPHPRSAPPDPPPRPTASTTSTANDPPQAPDLPSDPPHTRTTPDAPDAATHDDDEDPELGPELLPKPDRPT